MSIYTESLREKEKYDNLAEQLSEDALSNNKKVHENAGQHINNWDAISEICHRLDVDIKPVRNCNSIVELLECVLDSQHMIYDTISLSKTVWQNQKEYILAFLKDGTPVILRPSMFGYVCEYLQNNTTGKVDINELQDTAYVIFRPFMKNKFSMKEFILLVFNLMKINDIISIIISIGLVSALGLVVPKISKIVLGPVVELGSEGIILLSGLISAYIVAGVLKAFFSVIKTKILGQTKNRIASQINTIMMGRIMMMPYDFFRRKSVGKMTFQMRNCKTLSNGVVDFVFNNMISVVFSLIYIPQMASISNVLFVPALLILLIQILINVGLFLLDATNDRRILESQQNYEGVLFDVIRGIQRINDAGAQKRFYAKLANSYRKYLADEFDPPLFVKLNEVIVELLASLGIFILLILAARDNVTSGNYVAFVASFGLLSSSVDSLVEMTKTIISMRPLVEQMRILFAYNQEMDLETEYVKKLNGKIDVNDLCFSYDDNKEKTLNHITFHIDSGQKVAFVGESGCGKSTLMKLLLGMLKPDSGRIQFDGKPIESLNKRSLRMRIGTVFQFTQIFPTSLRDNISFSRENITEEEVWEAAEKAAIADHIKSLPMGMDTEISEGNGGGFSGGQKQRLMLARVFAQKPSIMILDEATSALDNILQKKVLDSVYASPATVIMIAHRLSTVVDCDCIMALKDGRIVESGTYQELMDLKGYFAELVQKQIVDIKGN